MFVYKISEILKALNSAKSEGFEYVELSIIEADDDSLEDTLSIDYVVSKNDSENDMIDSISLPDGYQANV